MSMFKWEVVDPEPGEAVAPDQRLAWGKTVGLGAQHVIAMFGATFVFPIIMGLNPNLAILMSGIATICFLLIVRGVVPSYLGTSASFVGGATAIYTYSGGGGPGGPTDVTGAILVSGIVLAVIGVIVHFAGADVVNAILPPVVTGGVVMVIGFNLAGVATGIYMPADRWMAIITMTAVILMAVGLRGFLGRIAIFLGLILGYVLSWLFDVIGVGGVKGDRVNWDGVKSADWLGFPPHTASGLVGNQNTDPNFLTQVGWHWPSFSVTFALLALPAVIALVAENMGHVKAVAQMTGRDLDPVMGRAIAADGVGTVIASAVGGSPTTTYAENIGVMAATRVYSTAAYFVAAIVAILLGFIPKFGAIVAATPGGVLGGITLVLYGMIGMLGAKIWVENRVNFADPVNLVPVAAGLTLGIGLGTTGFFKITDNFQLGGIALGTIVIIGGYHLARAVAPKRDDDGTLIAVGQTGAHVEDHAAPHHREHTDPRHREPTE
jgi:uracil-xanthine permease